jgi:hypothetical protein
MSGVVLTGASAAAVVGLAASAGAGAVTAAPADQSACLPGSRSLVPQKSGLVDLNPGQSYRTKNGTCIAWANGREATVHEAVQVDGVPARSDTWRIHATPTSVAFTDCVKTEVLSTRNAVFELADPGTRIGVRTDGKQITGIRVFPEALALNRSDMQGFIPAKDLYYMPVGCDKVPVGVIEQHI